MPNDELKPATEQLPSEAEVAGRARGSEIWLCPFCRRECEVGWDCECGAKSMASPLWLEESRPLMRAGCLSEMGLLLGLMAEKNATGSAVGANRSIREMLHSPNNYSAQTR